MSDPLLQPVEIAGLRLRNRVMMAPMTMYTADADGTVSDSELDFYRSRAEGPGLLLTGCTHVQPNGVGFIEEFAAYDDRFIPSLTALAQAAKSGGNAAVLQIFHAGSKAIASRLPDGAVVSASSFVAPPSSQAPGGTITRALTDAEIHDAIRAFGETTRRAIEAGFDGVEIHGAHGFLQQQFLSPRYNTRTDSWGGSLEGRSRFGLETVREVRRVIDAHADRPFVLGYRVSPEEPEEGGLTFAESLGFVDLLLESGGVDYLHASLYDAVDGRPMSDPDGAPIARQIVDRVAGRVPVAAAGAMLTPARARDALDLGLTTVAVGRGIVLNPDWVQLLGDGRERDLVTAFDTGKSAEQHRIPSGLDEMVRTTAGWFPLVDA
ncbi:NADH-dependent flavin oxidoreductase [Tsukamurella sp. NPDC003166]|uniref:NADH-dependent flavin oxidoreductase n=1 Tax=Tsukamurella sp. NPDC003166 TaxID=3154444 RepID=UPI0033B9657A